MVSASGTATASSRRTARLNKVPVITATFWVIKILSTTIGETFADYLSVNVGLGPLVTDAVVFAVLTAALVGQFRSRQYTPWIYWLCVVLVSIFGTQITDFLTDTLHVSLYLSTALFAIVLVVVFVVWHRQELTLSITSIDTTRREGFYWGAILTTFALGTAAGDLANEALSLGFRNGTLVFATAFLATMSLWRVRAWQVAAFWVAYILTRPLGASIGDLLTQDRQYGGLGLGASLTSALFFAVIAVLVAREQVVVHRTGVSTKGTGQQGNRTADRLWATAGAAAVVAVSAWFVVTAGPDPGTDTAGTAASDTGAADSGGGAADVGSPGPSAGQVTGGSAPALGSSAGAAASSGAGQSTTARPAGSSAPTGPVSKLGRLTSFDTIVRDVSALTRSGDLAGAKTKIKDLEIAWDAAEAGLKPRSPDDWHRLDTSIDGALTALRADHPTQADAQAALATLQATLNSLQGRAG